MSDYNYDNSNEESSSSSHQNNHHQNNHHTPSSSDCQNNNNLIITNTSDFHTPTLNYHSWLFLQKRLFSQPTPIHHIFFQLANFTLLILILFLLADSKKKTVKKILLILFSLFWISWGIFVLNSYDVVCWGGIYFSVGVVGLICEFCGWFCGSCCCNGVGRKISRREIAQVYKKLFLPLHVNKSQFAKILSCKRNTRQLHPGENYATEKITRVDSLALLLQGKLLVSQSGRPLHTILPHQFVDSPEYFGVSTDELFQVTIMAVEESKVLVWHRDKLRLTILADEFLREIFDHIIGRDVVRKLIQVSDCVSTTSQNNGTFYTTNSSKQHHNQNNKENINHNNLIINNGNEHEPMLTIIDGCGGGGLGGGGGGEGGFETTEIWSLNLTKIAEEETPV